MLSGNNKNNLISMPYLTNKIICVATMFILLAVVVNAIVVICVE